MYFLEGNAGNSCFERTSVQPYEQALCLIQTTAACLISSSNSCFAISLHACCQIAAAGDQHESVWYYQLQGGGCVCAGDPGVLCMGLYRGHLALAAPGQEGTGLCLCAVCPAASSGHISHATYLRLGRDPKSLDETPASSEEGPGSGLLEVVTTLTIPEED